MRVVFTRRAGVLLAACVAGVAALPSAQALAASRQPVPASGPQVTRGAVDEGATPAAAAQDIRVYIAPRGGLDALKNDVAAVSTPGSASYHEFLTPAQFRARYQPTTATVNSVTKWLRGEGLKIAGIEHAARYIAVTGTAAAAERAFSTHLHQYSKNGQTFQAPARAVTVPLSIAGAVVAVSGLDTAVHTMKPHQFFPPPPAFVNGRPCSLFYGQLLATFQADYQTPLPKFQGSRIPYAPCGYTPIQFRTAYEQQTKYTGAGGKVGIIDAYAAPTIEADANTYATRHGDPAFTPGQFTQTIPAKFDHAALCDPSGWYGEETLDVEAVHGMAPGAGVHYYGVKSCLNADFPDVLDRVVDDNDVEIVSNSYGDLDQNETLADITANEQAFLQGAIQGITWLFSSGDNGDEVANSGLLQTDYPASDPYVTAVGGTSTGIGSTGQLLFQTGWGTVRWSLSPNGKSWVDPVFLYGSGGGFSTLFNRPAYQQKVVPPTSPPGRAVPDVALDGDPTTGMLVGETQTFPSGVAYGEYRIGGTSLSSPLMAGFQATTEQRAGGRQGFLNPTLYNDAKQRPTLFIDIAGPGPDPGNVRADNVNGIDPSDGIAYTVRAFNQDSSLQVAPGWDPVTGIGSPSPLYLLRFNTP
jgi:subtilase family serine protease